MSKAMTVDILNCLTGHLAMKFDTPAEAKRNIEELQRKGYTIFIEVGDTTRKCIGFDENTNEFIVHDDPPEVKEDWKLGALTPPDQKVPLAEAKVIARDKEEMRVLASSAQVTAVAPLAGG